MSESRIYGRPIGALDVADFIGVPNANNFYNGTALQPFANPISPELFLPYGTVSGQLLIWNGFSWVGAVASFASGATYASGVASGTTQQQATVLTSQRTIITAGAGLGVQVNNAPTNISWEIWNRTGGNLFIYPLYGSSSQLETYGIGAPVLLSNGDRAVVVYLTSTQGYVG